MKEIEVFLESENTSNADETASKYQNSMCQFTEDEMRFVTRIDSTGLTFDDVCGMEKAKELLILPLFYNMIPNRVSRFLLFGPPGTGKSLILEALVGEARARPETAGTTFFALTLPIVDLVNLSDPGTVGELLSKLFMVASMEKPSIIFIEWVDGLVSSSNLSENKNAVIMRNAFCKEMKNIPDGVFVMCTTNAPQKLIDYPDVLRHFNHLIYISVPNKADRLNMLKKFFNGKLPTNLQVEDLEKLATKTRGLSGDDLNRLYKNAVGRAYNRVEITQEDMWILKRLSNLDLNYFDEIAKRLGADNGNLALEQLQKVKVSRTCKFISFLHDIFF